MRRWRFRGAVLMTLTMLAGCAPAEYGEAVGYYARENRVSDAGVRKAKGYWYLRFDELTLSDLDEAIQAGRRGNEAELRRQGLQVMRAAHSLALRSAEGEIDRLPERGRKALARRGGCEPTADALKAALARDAQQAVQATVNRLEQAPAGELLSELKRIRGHVEAAPDDQGRAGRQLLLAWGALPAALGISKVETDLEEHRAEVLNKVYERAVLWCPRERAGDDPLRRLAPTLVIEWPAQRDYPADYDRFGEIYLTGDPQHVQVNVNTSRPMVYTYRSEAKIGGRRYPQLAWSWWYPYHPEMKRNDPAAGKIDGDTLRVTLDRQGRPAVFEVIQSCGCGHLIFVSKELEEAARREFQTPEAGKSLCVEHDVAGKRDLIVMGTVDVPEGRLHPVIYVLAGYHEVSGIDIETENRRLDVKAVEEHEYDSSDYDILERLPLGEGVASMFGPDGLVHDAGRVEGYLLAPTGILSAGQPRKRGTQKIRWDEFSFDDPRLLEKALRFPKSF